MSTEERISRIRRELEGEAPTFTSFFDEGDPDYDPEELVNGAKRMHDGTFGVSSTRSYAAVGSWPPDFSPLRQQVHRAAALLRRARRGDPIVALRAVRSLRGAIEVLEFHAVVVARSCGWSWRDVADALGLATQTVHRRYAREEGWARRRRSRARA